MEKDMTYMVYESSLARMERQSRRLFALCIFIFSALIITNAGWIVYESKFSQEVTQTIETSTDGGGDAYGTLIDGDGEVHYGESEDN